MGQKVLGVETLQQKLLLSLYLSFLIYKSGVKVALASLDCYGD